MTAEAQDPDSAKKGKKRPPAKARLSEMETQSVHAVPQGANMRNKALILKSGQGVAMAVWSTAYVNDLPDSAFLYIAPGGEKDEDDKTVPRSLRYFPIRDQNGGLDLPHLTAAISRIPQSTAPGLTAEDKTALQERARQMLEEAQKEQEDMAGATEQKQEPPAPAAAPTAETPAATPPPAETETPAEGLELSTAAKEMLLMGITDAVEKLTGLGEAVGAAKINEEAPVPDDVVAILEGCSTNLATLAQQAAPPPAAESTPEATSPAAAPPGATPEEMAAKGEPADTETEKAGAVLSRKTRALLQTALDALTKLLQSADKDTGETAKGDAALEPSVAEEVAKAIDAAIAPMLARFEEQSAAVKAAIAAKDAASAAKDEQIAKMAAQANGTPPPNSSLPDGSPTGIAKTGVPFDLKEAYKLRMEQERAAATNHA